MPIPFKCPSCGGPLEYDGGEITTRCEFCSNSVIVPEELREAYGSRGPVPFHEQMANLKVIGRLIREGNKIAAVKLYRETFGVGSREATDAVDRLAGGQSVDVLRSFGVRHQGFPSPQHSQHLPQPTGSKSIAGCSAFVIGLVIFIAITVVVGSVILATIFSAGRRKSAGPSTKNSNSKPRSIGGGESSGFAREILKFGTEGIGPGKFKDARTVAIDGEGRIYTADYTGGRVQVFDSTGKFLTQWMVDPKMPLLKLAADRNGLVYIVQSGDINRYEGMTGRSLGKVTAPGMSFDDVIVLADGGLVAVDDSEDLVRFDRNGQVISTIKDSVSGQSGDSELDAKVAVDGLGNLYAMGRFNDAVFKYGPNGKFINRIGGEGDEPGLFRALHAIAIDGQGRIYVSDIKGIQVFDANGRYLDVFKVEKGGGFGLVFNDQNELFVAARTQIVKFALNK